MNNGSQVYKHVHTHTSLPPSPSRSLSPKEKEEKKERKGYQVVLCTVVCFHKNQVDLVMPLTFYPHMVQSRGPTYCVKESRGQKSSRIQRTGPDSQVSRIMVQGNQPDKGASWHLEIDVRECGNEVGPASRYR